MRSARGSALQVALVLLAAATGARGEELLPAVAESRAPPVLREHRYRMSAAIRPLLFWLGDGDVGGARIVWRGDETGRRGYEFLLGSDPERTPRKINRWGFVREELREDGAIQIGLMRKTDEKSVEEAHARVGFEGEVVFKAIRTEVAGSEVRSSNTVWLVENDYTYYGLDEVMRLVQGPHQAPPTVHEAVLPPGTHPGFLFAVAAVVDQAVAAASLEPRVLLKKVTTRFNFNAVA